jgi:hypothetical protein
MYLQEMELHDGAGYICLRTEASGGHVTMIMNQQVQQQSAAEKEPDGVKSMTFRRYANETVAHQY